ncbi:conserved Plasmodium protein, unknown function [Plasmodium gallinaceum]|uniref:Uncharacterized protein n=1 Tax=Plasmodium gallinaceum TaxID=5849 RepID=A0A1J1GSA6_PLAGA|nr:conserved Plasmodium protein, unknown function [Plasmodium gallinaceum]CRG94192.1 conserved Plasmodium protein, unknown function [Plasmodium gallinaceum]
MNKENIEKLLSIIDILDKITNSNETQNESENKLKSFISSELSGVFDDSNNQNSLFPLNYEQDVNESGANKIINEMKTTKSFFYINKTNMNENESEINEQTNFLRKDICSKHSIIQSYDSGKLSYLSDEKKEKNHSNPVININADNYEEFNKMNLDLNRVETISVDDTSRKTKYNEQICKMNSPISDMFSLIKIETDNFTSKRNSLNILRDYFSDTELLLFNNSNKKKKNLLNMLKKKELKKYNNARLRVDSLESTTRITHSKKYKTIQDKVELDGCLDHRIIGQLFEKIIEHLNVNLKETLNGYIKEINKLNKTNENLNNKLETAVENNDEQAQEIRDLNKRIKFIEEQKLELNKIIEKYEFEIDNSKKLENKMQSDEKQRSALGHEIKNLKKELNTMIILNDKIKKEKLLLQEKIKNQNYEIKKEKDKLRMANDMILEKNNLISKLQLAKNIDIPYKELKNKRHIIPYKTKNKIIERYQSDTILDNYDRIKNKLFESNERCFFLSKTNLELFKGLKKKKKKIDALNKQLSYLKHALLKGKEKQDESNSHILKEKNINVVKSSINSDSSSEKISKLMNKNNSLVKEEDNKAYELEYNEKICKIKNLEEILNNKISENNLLKKKYEILYKKYIKILKKKLRKNNDFTFIEKKIEEIFPKNDVIHSFYLKKSLNISKKNIRKDNKLISYIKAKVVDKNVNINKFKNYKAENNYNDVEFYVSNEILRRMDVKDILNIRYIYSYGNEKFTKQFSQNGSICNFYKCK